MRTQWETVAGYLQPFDLAAGQVLIDQGATRTARSSSSKAARSACT